MSSPPTDDTEASGDDIATHSSAKGSSRISGFQGGGTSGGCYVRTRVGLLLVTLGAALVVGVALAVFFATSSSRELSCGVPGAVGLVSGIPDAVKSCKDLMESGRNVAERICSACPSKASPLVTSATTSTGAATPTTLPYDRRKYRLPSAIIPSHYDLRLQPHIYGYDPTSFFFEGSASIDVTCREATDTITLHVDQLTIEDSDVKVREKESGVSVNVRQISYEAEPQFVHIRLSESLRVWMQYEIVFARFKGPLTSQRHGFYYTSYMDGDTVVYVAATKLPATYARRAFPCFDEPAMKATFNVTLLRRTNTGRDYHTLSNMDLLHTHSSSSSDWAEDVYQTTMRTSAHVLAFLVSDFRSVFNYTMGVKLSIWARPNAVQYAGRALELGQRIFESLENTFSPSYSTALSKLVPGFGYNAVDNWGIIYYGELLLYRPGVTTAYTEHYIGLIMAHEIAHVWFGNVVTPKRWHWMWLSEAMASFWHMTIMDDINPTGRMTEEWVAKGFHGIMGSDALATSRPLTADVETPAEIAAILDAITISKGAFIIRMMSFIMGHDNFVTGLNNYLSGHAFGNVDGGDLWGALNAVSLPGVDMGVKMDPWVSQMGYPVVTATRSSTGDGTLRLRQQRFLLGPDEGADHRYRNPPYHYQWDIPITMASSQNPNFTKTGADIVWMKRGNPGGGGEGWFILNVQQYGYYRVHYDRRNWLNLIRQLNTDHTVIHPINRAQIINDAWNLVNDNDDDDDDDDTDDDAAAADTGYDTNDEDHDDDDDDNDDTNDDDDDDDDDDDGDDDDTDDDTNDDDDDDDDDDTNDDDDDDDDNDDDDDDDTNDDDDDDDDTNDDDDDDDDDDTNDDDDDDDDDTNDDDDDDDATNDDDDDDDDDDTNDDDDDDDDDNTNDDDDDDGDDDTNDDDDDDGDDALSRADMLDLETALKTVEFLSKELDYLPWKAFAREIHYVELMLERSQLYTALKTYLLELVNGPLHKLTLDITPQVDPLGVYCRVLLAGLACSHGQPSCVRLAQQQFDLWRTTGGNNGIDANLRYQFYCTAVERGGPREWNFLLQQFLRETDVQEGPRLRQALACAREPALLRRLLHMAMNDSQSMDFAQMIGYVSANRWGRDVAFQFLVEHFSSLDDLLGNKLHGVIGSVTEHFNSQFDLQRVDLLERTSGSPAFSRTLQQARAQTRDNMRWIHTHTATLRAWLLKEEGPPRGTVNYYRLPGHVVPQHYRLQLQPHMYGPAPSAFFFEGSVTIRVRCVRPATTITLHMKALTFSDHDVSVKQENNNQSELFRSSSYEGGGHFLHLHLRDGVEAGKTYLVAFRNFSGPLTSDGTGLYLSHYRDGEDTVYLATSMMEPVDARKALPCFDEPQLKATFDVTLVRKNDTGRHYISLANAPYLNTDYVQDRGGHWWARDRFQTTPLMPTYLLAFVVCDFLPLENSTASEPNVTHCGMIAITHCRMISHGKTVNIIVVTVTALCNDHNHALCNDHNHGKTVNIIVVTVTALWNDQSR
ncbi:hypothetical protein ACOMHN_008570 [Nucella lapillus]